LVKQEDLDGSEEGHIQEELSKIQWIILMVVEKEKVLVEDTQFLLKDNQQKVLKLETINEQINSLLKEEINERILNNG
jgi:hypothetical protein